MNNYLEKEVQDLLSLLEQQFDEDSITVENLDLNTAQKARQYISGNMKAIDEEIERLKERKQALQNDKNKLSDCMLSTLKRDFGGKLKTALFTFSTRTTESLVIEDEDKVPDEFKKVEVSVKKLELKKHIKETGESFDGVKIETSESLYVR